MPPARCLVLLSGGMDSMLAARLIQQQSIEVEGIHFATLFTSGTERAQQVARQLEIPLQIVSPSDDYLEVVRRPRFGYGRSANPCVDCRIFLFRLAENVRQERAADFVISGEVLGQTRDGQKRRDLEWIAHHSGLGDRLLRPLSAQQLPETRPEREGIVDRQRLLGVTGSSRKELFRLARNWGLPSLASPQNACALTDGEFGRKVFDLLRFEPSASHWAFALLRVGRHLRYGKRTKFVLGRHREDNQRMGDFFETAPKGHVQRLTPVDFSGPTVLVVGDSNERTIQVAHHLLLRHARQRGRVRWERSDGTEESLLDPS